MFYTALILGLAGSFHCFGMCGPLIMALPSRGKTNIAMFGNGLMHHSGRVLTYSMLGLLAGTLGSGFALAGTQNMLSIVFGSLMVLIPLSVFIFRKNPLAIRLSGMITKPISKLFKKKGPFIPLAIGALNGLLPCGLVYMAMIGSIAVGDPAAGAMYMMLFGLGTLPMMLAVHFARMKTGQRLRTTFRRITPALVMVVGMLFILRGLELGIPYVSPKTHEMQGKMIQSQDEDKGLSAGSDGVVCH